MDGIIYCIQSPSGKKYIGQTRRRLEKRVEEHTKQYQKHESLIHKAICKYGIDACSIEVLKRCSIGDLDHWEQHFIKEMKTICPHGYNIRSGGSKHSGHCEASREKMRLSKLGEKNHNFGKPRSKETRQKISESKQDTKHHFFGKQLQDEHKIKAAISHRKRDCDKELPMYLVYVKPRPKNYTQEGYAVVNHPLLKNKYFTSKKLSLEEKLHLATQYLSSLT